MRNRDQRLLPALVLLASGLPALARAEWAVTYGDHNRDHIEAIQQTTDGGYIAAGFKTPEGGNTSDFWVQKLRDDGSSEWQKTYGGPLDDAAYAVLQASDGTYVVAGRTKSFGAPENDLWLLRLDANGQILSQKAFRGNDGKWPRALQQTTDGGLVIAGTLTHGTEIGDFWVLKLGPSGAVQWQKTYGGAGDEYLYGMQQTSDGGYVVTGYTDSFGAGGKDVWLLKLHPNGEIASQGTYGGAQEEEGRSVRQTADGGFLVGASTASFGAGQGDVWVLKLAADGTTQWQKTYGGAGDEGRIRSGEQMPDGGYIVAVGETTSFGRGAQDAWLLRLDAAGGVQWQKTFGGFAYDESEQLRLTSDGGFIVIGNTNSFGEGSDDWWIMKLHPNGTLGVPCPVFDDTDATPQGTAAARQETAAVAQGIGVMGLGTAAVVNDTSTLMRGVCPGEICYGGVDDDGDGDVDCEDADCDGENVCLPDLVSAPPGSYFRGPASWQGGTKVSAALHVRNQGGSPSGGFQVSTFLSDEPVPNPGIALVAVHQVGPIAVGAERFLRITISAAEPMAGKYLISWIDSVHSPPGGPGNVEESDEQNNFAAAQIP